MPVVLMLLQHVPDVQNLFGFMHSHANVVDVASC